MQNTEEYRLWYFQDEHDLRQIGGGLIRYENLDYISVKVTKVVCNTV